LKTSSRNFLFGKIQGYLMKGIDLKEGPLLPPPKGKGRAGRDLFPST